jgi:hypothetical protein
MDDEPTVAPDGRVLSQAEIAARRETRRYFSELVNHVDDEFWKEKFRECSRNEFPPGVRFQATKKTLSIRPATAGTSHFLTFALGANMTFAAQQCAQAFRDCLLIFSERDLEISGAAGSADEKSLAHVSEWKQFTRKAQGEKAIVDFLAERGATADEVSRLARRLHILILLKKIRNEDITVHEGRIETIAGCSFSRAGGDGPLELTFAETDREGDTARSSSSKSKGPQVLTQAISNYSKKNKTRTRR